MYTFGMGTGEKDGYDSKDENGFHLNKKKYENFNLRIIFIKIVINNLFI